MEQTHQRKTIPSGAKKHISDKIIIPGTRMDLKRSTLRCANWSKMDKGPHPKTDNSKIPSISQQ